VSLSEQKTQQNRRVIEGALHNSRHFLAAFLARKTRLPLVQLAVQSVEHEVLAAIDRKIPLHIRTQWLEALHSTQLGSEATLLEWLREPPGNFSPSSIERRSKKVEHPSNSLASQ
jgi:hypothetical protein